MRFITGKCEAGHIEGKISKLHVYTLLLSIAQKKYCDVTRDNFKENICFRLCCSQNPN